MEMRYSIVNPFVYGLNIDNVLLLIDLRGI